MAPGSRNPTTWAEYEGVASPSGSLSPSALTEALLDDEAEDEDAETGGDANPLAARRRSSVTDRLATMADLGGVNSFRSFARSWQRAAGFAEVIPRRPSFVLAHGQSPQHQPYAEERDQQRAQHEAQHDDEIRYRRSHVDRRPPAAPGTSLLSQHLDDSPPSSGRLGLGSTASPQLPAAAAPHDDDDDDDDFRQRESKALDADAAAGALSTSSRSSIFAVPPHLAAPSVVGSFASHAGSPYGTIGPHSVRPRLSLGHLGPTASSGVLGGGDAGGGNEEEELDTALGEHDPILVKEVRQGNKIVLTVEGQSTLPQSIFNSINALIGVGLLSLPLAFKMSGWVLGLLLLTLTASATAHTGHLLAVCMRYDPSLITYSDLAYVSFGSRARMIVSALFTLELVAACVALVILFADSLVLLLPGLASVNVWKCVCAVLVLALNAMPLRWLSYTSVLGIFSTFCIVCIVIVDGLLKTDPPGSLWRPATTYLFPSNWLSLPLAYGLLASPWGAHSVFPSIYRDMRHPHKWDSAVKVTFSFSYLLDTCLAVIGILMFGDGIDDAITSNILRTVGFPKALTIFMCIFIAIIPLTKIPLNTRPLITTGDVLCGIHHALPTLNRANRRAAIAWHAKRSAVRLVIVLVLLAISILFPAFDSVCAFLGAALCSLISIILPISFYLKLFGRDITAGERLISWLLLILFSLLGLVGTVWTFLPKHLVGA